ncbi:insulinase family protein, partial [candidate division WOR-3 bacterium]|nr:insulinase family protein [candidate division WOR-3 bacterium]
KKLRKNDISQVHVALGTIAIKYKNKLRYPWLILNTFLGGGMSSRLFQRLREKEALVYEITSFIELLSDTGAFGIYFVTDPKNVQIAIEYIWDEFRKLNKNGLEPMELQRTKEHLKGNLMLSLESMTSRMVRLLSNEMYLNRNISLEETIKNIENVDEKVLRSIANNYLTPEIYSISKVGPKV